MDSHRLTRNHTDATELSRKSQEYTISLSFITSDTNSKHSQRFSETVPIVSTDALQFKTARCLRLCTRSYEGETIFTKVGKEIKEISDCSWMATNNSMSCWEKAHSHCIPKGLFLQATSQQVNQEWDASGKDKMQFVNVALSSELHVAKRRAFGMAPTKRGGKKKAA